MAAGHLAMEHFYGFAESELEAFVSKINRKNLHTGKSLTKHLKTGWLDPKEMEKLKDWYEDLMFKYEKSRLGWKMEGNMPLPSVVGWDTFKTKYLAVFKMCVGVAFYELQNHELETNVLMIAKKAFFDSKAYKSMVKKNARRTRKKGPCLEPDTEFQVNKKFVTSVKETIGSVDEVAFEDEVTWVNPQRPVVRSTTAAATEKSMYQARNRNTRSSSLSNEEGYHEISGSHDKGFVVTEEEGNSDNWSDEWEDDAEYVQITAKASKTKANTRRKKKQNVSLRHGVSRARRKQRDRNVESAEEMCSTSLHHEVAIGGWQTAPLLTDSRWTLPDKVKVKGVGYLCIEIYSKENTVGYPAETFHHRLIADQDRPERLENYLEKSGYSLPSDMWFIPMTQEEFVYGMRRADLNYHCNVGVDFGRQLMKAARKYNIAVHECKGENTINEECVKYHPKIGRKGVPNDIFRKAMQHVRFNEEFLTRVLIESQSEGGSKYGSLQESERHNVVPTQCNDARNDLMYVSRDEEAKNRVVKALQTKKCEDRGTTQADFGVANHAFETQTEAASANFVNPRPKLIHNDSQEVKDLQAELGSIIDGLLVYLRMVLGIEQFNDLMRSSVFGRMFSDAVKCSILGIEAVTVALTHLCSIEEFNLLREDKNIKLRQKLNRHVDGPNDWRPGYDWTVIWSKMFEMDGQLYRLTVIAYSRKSVGDWMDKEYQAIDTVLDVLKRYKHEYNGNIPFEQFHISDDMCRYKVLPDRKLRLATDIRPDEEQAMSITWIEDERLELGSKALAQVGPEIRLPYLKVKEFVDSRDLFHSAFVDAIKKVHDKHHLTKRSVYEMFLAAIHCASPVLFRQCALTRWVNKPSHFFDRTNLVIDYSDWCRVRGLSPQAGPDLRFVPGRFPGNVDNRYLLRFEGLYDDTTKVIDKGYSAATREQEAEEFQKVAKEVCKLQGFVARANEEKDYERIIADMKLSDNNGGLRDVGHVKSLFFYPVGVMLGLVNTEVGLKGALHASINEKARYRKDLEELGITGTMYGDRLLDTVCKRLRLAKAQGEQSLCAGFRNEKRDDLVFKDMSIYRTLSDGVYCKQFGRDTYVRELLPIYREGNEPKYPRDYPYQYDFLNH